MPGLRLVRVLNPKSKEQGIIHDKCFMKSTHSMVMPTEIWQFSLLSLSLLHFPIHASGHTVEPCCSCPCLWSLVHHFSDITWLCLEEPSRRDRTFPGFPRACLHFCFHFICQSFSLLLLGLFRGVSFLTPLSMFSVTWVENDLTECWGGVQVLLALTFLGNFHMYLQPVLLWWAVYFSMELEIVGLRCLVISSRIR